MSEAPDSRAGSTFGPYRLKRLLGRGGMGEVYEAEHTVKEWTVAVKVMTTQFSKDPVFRERMKREARITGRLQEPHVVPIHDYGEIDGQMYLEMRMIEGTDLDNLLKRHGPLTPPRAVAIITQIASALDAAHAAEVTHRDVKPPNILVTKDDFAYLVDFGIANATTDEKLTQMGTAVGTWKYMAPERFSSDEVTYRADIYSLACVLYECLTGTPPYRADSATTLLTAHLMDPVPQASAARAGIPKALDAVITRGMAKRPEDRNPSAGDFARAAHEALSIPDRDHADNIVRRSQESAVPPAPQATPDQTVSAGSWPPATPTPNPSAPVYGQHPYGSGPLPSYPPGGTPAWAPQAGSNPPSGPTPAPQYFQGGGVAGAPPQQPGGPASWNQGIHPPGRKRNPWPIVAGAAALALVLVLAAIGAWYFTRSGDKGIAAGPSTSVRTATPPPTTPSPGDAQRQLMAALPSGYPSGVCTATTPKPNSVWTGTIAMVSCGQNTNRGGPSRAFYGLFGDLATLQQAFDDDIAAVELADCPGSGPSPDSWQYDRDPTVAAGMVACGIYKDHPNVIWTNNSKLTLSDTFGDPVSLADLHDWWAKYG
ncbi:protein kinase domain-containing protein [Mycobacterium sp.]|uniref:serine/threonine-protein kinase n=1 Tax=Mycobacterium sp. TaxID=1785 RepID=UPI003A89DF8E